MNQLHLIDISDYDSIQFEFEYRLLIEFDPINIFVNRQLKFDKLVFRLKFQLKN